MNEGWSVFWFIYILKHNKKRNTNLKSNSEQPLNMSRDMTKPLKWVCAQRRLRSAQSLRGPHEQSLGP